jgi:hypothetical protein
LYLLLTQFSVTTKGMAVSVTNRTQV